MLLMEHLGLRWVQVLHGVGIRVASTWWHATPHEGGRVDLRPWLRHPHMPY